MALRTDATGERLDCYASLPAWNAVTFAAWVRVVVDRAADSYIFQWANSGDTNGVYMLINSSRVIQLENSGSGAGFTACSTTLTVGAWYHLAMTYDGSNVRAYVNGVLDGTRAFSTSFTPYGLLYGGNSAYLNARWAHAKAWSAVLTADELAAEGKRARPVRDANLHSFLPLFANLNELFAQRSWTLFGGSASYEDGPPVGWGASPLYVQAISAAASGIYVPGYYL